jgi:hypothetical protein
MLGLRCQSRTLRPQGHVEREFGQYRGLPTHFHRYFGFSGHSPVLRAQLYCGSGQMLAHDVDVGQSELAENLLAVLV